MQADGSPPDRQAATAAQSVSQESASRSRMAPKSVGPLRRASGPSSQSETVAPHNKTNQAISPCRPGLGSAA